MNRITLSTGVLLAISACSTHSDSPLQLATAAEGRDTRLTLHAAPGYEINARVAPALVLETGAVVRFTSAKLSADSTAFADPPTALLTGRHDRVRGTLRASVCVTTERVCRSVTLRL